MSVQFEKTFLQQDRARPHAVNKILHLLHEHFADGVIWNRFPQSSGCDGLQLPVLLTLTLAITFCRSN
jgi:hypothetical protein